MELTDKIIEAEYSGLNIEQREAVITVDGPILILAGAGSGKTTVLVNRIAHLLNYAGENHTGIYPSQILAITFTNKAAEEMRNRVRVKIGEEADSMWISTFHSTCVKILRREADKIGYNKNFTIYDSLDQKSLIRQCMQDLNIDEKDITEKEIISKIGAQKDGLVSADTFRKDSVGNYRTSKIAEVYFNYQKRLKANNAMDFDDLIVNTVELFKKNQDVLDFYQRKFKYIMVDEYQDTNKAQYELVKLLATKNKNICVVGDDDQCIYQWRGADISNILDFEKDYPSCKVIKLEQNYRSKGNILKAANEVIKNNTRRKSKVLRTEKELGEKIKTYRAYSDLDEASFVASKISTIKAAEDKCYKDFAVLYRTNSQSRVFEDSFIMRNIPYRIIGGVKFYDRKEIKDLLAYLKLINNPSDDISLRRIINVPKRSIGDTTISKLQEEANRTETSMFDTILNMNKVPSFTARNITSINKFKDIMETLIEKREKITISQLIQEILEETGYIKELKDSKNPEDISRVENLEELVSAAAEFENNSEDKTLAAFLEKIALVSDIDNFDKEADTVVLMTVHSAKGLEFPVVFMVGMENGLFPGQRSLNDMEEMEESRRLCYVGITRAKEVLFMTNSEKRMIFGHMVAYPVSDFIEEIPKDLRESLNINMNSQASNVYKSRISDILDNKSMSSKIASNNTLTEEEAKPGTKVKHMKFGLGTIVTVTGDGSSKKLTIAFDNMGIKTFMLNMAPLEVL